MKLRPISVAALLAAGAVILGAGLLSYSSVDNAVTAEDRRYISLYLELPQSPADKLPYARQLELVGAVQHAVLGVAPASEGLPLGTEREPKDLFEAGTGQCFDRSRVIEKILRSAGFTTRHVSLYSTQRTHSAIRSLMTPGVSSHAVTEVRTRAGWLVVDSNAAWLALDGDGRPVSIAGMRSAATGATSIHWQQPPPAGIYEHPFVFVYGLYSRHGRFYPPYNPIPDVNYRELLYNVPYLFRELVAAAR